MFSSKLKLLILFSISFCLFILFLFFLELYFIVYPLNWKLTLECDIIFTVTHINCKKCDKTGKHIKKNEQRLLKHNSLIQGHLHLKVSFYFLFFVCYCIKYTLVSDKDDYKMKSLYAC